LRYSISDKINKGYQLFIRGNIEEASRLVEDLEKVKELTQEENLSCQLLKANVFSEMGKDDESLLIAKQVFQNAKKLGYVFLAIRAIQARRVSRLNLGTYWEEGEIHSQLGGVL